MLTVVTLGIFKRIFKICIYLCKKKQKKFSQFFLKTIRQQKVLKPPAHLIYFPSKKFQSYEPIILSISRKENFVIVWILNKEHKFRSFFRAVKLFYYWPKILTESWQHCTGHYGQKDKASRALFNGGTAPMWATSSYVKQFIFKAGYVINIFLRFNGAVAR